MLRCPNKNTKSWKRMVEALGEPGAYYAYMQNGYDLLNEKKLGEYVESRSKGLENVSVDNTEQELTTLASKLSSLYGTQVTTISPEEAFKKLERDPVYKQFKKLIEDDKVSHLLLEKIPLNIETREDITSYDSYINEQLALIGTPMEKEAALLKLLATPEYNNYELAKRKFQIENAREELIDAGTEEEVERFNTLISILQSETSIIEILNEMRKIDVDEAHTFGMGGGVAQKVVMSTYLGAASTISTLMFGAFTGLLPSDPSAILVTMMSVFGVVTGGSLFTSTVNGKDASNAKIEEIQALSNNINAFYNPTTLKTIVKGLDIKLHKAGIDARVEARSDANYKKFINDWRSRLDTSTLETKIESLIAQESKLGNNYYALIEVMNERFEAQRKLIELKYSMPTHEEYDAYFRDKASKDSRVLKLAELKANVERLLEMVEKNPVAIEKVKSGNAYSALVDDILSIVYKNGSFKVANNTQIANRLFDDISYKADSISGVLKRIINRSGVGRNHIDHELSRSLFVNDIVTVLDAYDVENLRSVPEKLNRLLNDYKFNRILNSSLAKEQERIADVMSKTDYEILPKSITNKKTITELTLEELVEGIEKTKESNPLLHNAFNQLLREKLEHFAITRDAMSVKPKSIFSRFKSLFQQYQDGIPSGFYDRNEHKAYLVTGVANKGTAFHEVFLHPFLDQIQITNKQLYTNLVNEARNNVQAVAYVEEMYGKESVIGANEFEQELIGKVFDMAVAGELDAIKDKGLIAALLRLWKEFNDYMRGLLKSKEIKSGELRGDMSIEQVAQLAVYNSRAKMNLQNTSISDEDALQSTISEFMVDSEGEGEIVRHGEDSMRTLEQELVDGFLKDFGITINEYDNLKDVLNVDASSAVDLITKTIIREPGESIIGEVAYIAYKMLGKSNNKLRSDLNYNIHNWDKYSERFAYHVEQYKKHERFINNKQLFKNLIREKVIVDFLSEHLEGFNPEESFDKIKDVKWTSDDVYAKSLWRRLVDAIMSLLRKFGIDPKKQERLAKLRNIGMSIADEVLSKNYEYFNYNKTDDQVLKDYNETLNSDPKAKEIVNYVLSNTNLILTGSIAYRMAGTTYRTADEAVHDIDFIVPYEEAKTISDEFGGILPKVTLNKNLILDVLQKQSWFNTIKAKYPNWHLNTSFTDNIEQIKYNNRVDTVTVLGVIDGEFRDSDGTHEKEVKYFTKDSEGRPVKSKKTVNVQHKKGDWIEGTGYQLDFFIRTKPKMDEHENQFKLWKQTFKAKLQMGREKDFIDWKYFIPYRKSNDKYDFKYQQYRHIRYKDDIVNALDDGGTINDTNIKQDKPVFSTGLPPSTPPADIALKTLLDDLSQRFDIEYEFVTTDQAKELLGDNYKEGAKGFFYNDKVYMVEGMCDMNTAIHEFAHPFVDVLFNVNHDLFRNLYKEATEAIENGWLAPLSSDYDTLSKKDIMKETIVHALAQQGENKIDKKTGKTLLAVITKFYEWLKSELIRFFSFDSERVTNYTKSDYTDDLFIDAIIKSLYSGTKLSEIANLIVASKSRLLNSDVQKASFAISIAPSFTPSNLKDFQSERKLWLVYENSNAVLSSPNVKAFAAPEKGKPDATDNKYGDLTYGYVETPDGDKYTAAFKHFPDGSYKFYESELVKYTTFYQSIIDHSRIQELDHKTIADGAELFRQSADKWKSKYQDIERSSELYNELLSMLDSDGFNLDLLKPMLESVDESNNDVGGTMIAGQLKANGLLPKYKSIIDRINTASKEYSSNYEKRPRKSQFSLAGNKITEEKSEQFIRLNTIYRRDFKKNKEEHEFKILQAEKELVKAKSQTDIVESSLPVDEKDWLVYYDYNRHSGMYKITMYKNLNNGNYDVLRRTDGSGLEQYTNKKIVPRHEAKPVDKNTLLEAYNKVLEDAIDDYKRAESKLTNAKNALASFIKRADEFYTENHHILVEIAGTNIERLLESNNSDDLNLATYLILGHFNIQQSTNILDFTSTYNNITNIVDKLEQFKRNTFSSSSAPQPIPDTLIPDTSTFHKLRWFVQKYNTELERGILPYEARTQIIDALINASKLLKKKIARVQVNALPLDDDYKENLVNMLEDPDMNNVAIEILNSMYTSYGIAQPDLTRASLEKDAIDEYLATDNNHKAGMQAIKVFMEDLKARTGVEYVIDTPEQINKDLPGSIAYFNPNDRTIHVSQYVSFDTVFHEFCHPFVSSLYITNRPLFDKLYNQITDDGKNVLQFYSNAQSYQWYIKGAGEEKTKEETFVRAMEMNAKGKVNTTTGKPIIEAIQRFLDWLKKFLFGDLNATIKTGDLSLNTTLRELTEMMLAHKGKIEMVHRGVTFGRMQAKVDDVNDVEKYSTSMILSILSSTANEVEFLNNIKGDDSIDEALQREKRELARLKHLYDSGLPNEILDIKNTIDEDDYLSIASDYFSELLYEIENAQSSVHAIISAEQYIDYFKHTYPEITQHEHFNLFLGDPETFAPVIAAVIYDNIGNPDIKAELEENEDSTDNTDTQPEYEKDWGQVTKEDVDAYWRDVYDDLDDNSALSLFTPKAIQQTLTKQEITKLAKDLSQRLDIPFGIINEPSLKWGGCFKDGKVYLNLAHITPETPFHEFMHPFLESVIQDNPELYNTLLEEMRTTDYGKQVLKEAQELYDNGKRTQEEIEKEAVVEMIARLASGKIPASVANDAKNKTLWSKIVAILREIGRKLFKSASKRAKDMQAMYEQTMHVEDISNKWRALDIANLLKYGVKINGEHNTMYGKDNFGRTDGIFKGIFEPQHSYSVGDMQGVTHYIGAFMNNAGMNTTNDAVKNFVKLLKIGNRLELAASSGLGDDSNLRHQSAIALEFKDDARVKYAFALDVGSELQEIPRTGEMRRVATSKNLQNNKGLDILEGYHDEMFINATRDNISSIQMLNDVPLDKDIIELSELTGAKVVDGAREVLYTPTSFGKVPYKPKTMMSLFMSEAGEHTSDSNGDSNGDRNADELDTRNPSNSNIAKADFNIIVIGNNLISKDQATLARIQNANSIVLHEEELRDNYTRAISNARQILSSDTGIQNANVVIVGNSNFDEQELARDIFTSDNTDDRGNC